METKNNKQTIYVSFHIGRGGRFNNPGHVSFHGEENFQQLIQRCMDVCMINNEDEKGNPLPDEDWQLIDTGGNVILEGREEVESMTGRLEWDTIYDTDYVKTIDELSEDEVELIWKAYLDEEYMSNELKDAICTLKEKKRVSGIKRYPSNIQVSIQHSVENIDVDQMCGKYTRDEWKEDLEERGFCPISVEKILDSMDYYDSNTEDFFCED